MVASLFNNIYVLNKSSDTSYTWEYRTYIVATNIRPYRSRCISVRSGSTGGLYVEAKGGNETKQERKICEGCKGRERGVGYI